MNYKYLSLVLIVCFMVSFFLCGCSARNSNRRIVIKHESYYAKVAKKKVANVIDLSDGKRVNFDFAVGPQDVSTPSFRVIKLDR